MIKLERVCPICKGAGILNHATHRGKEMDKKKITALKLQKEGYSIREIMVMMGYKSPRSVQVLLNK